MNVFFYPNSDIVALVERVTSPSTGYSVLNTHDLVLRHCCKAGIQSNSQWQCQRCVIKAWVLSQNRLFIFFHNQMVLLLNQFVQRVTHLLWLRSISFNLFKCMWTNFCPYTHPWCSGRFSQNPNSFCGFIWPWHKQLLCKYHDVGLIWFLRSGRV